MPLTIEVDVSIDLATDLAKIRANREKLKAQAEKLKAALAMVRAMGEANQRMCKHPNGRGYTDYGGGWSFDCPDCGHSS